MEENMNRMGGAFTEIGLLQLQMAALRQYMIEGDVNEQLAHDLIYQQLLRDQLEEAERQLNRQKLLAPGTVPSNNVHPMQR